MEHRFLGLDTRVFPHALVILAVWLLWAVVVPAIDSAVPSTNPVVVGDQLSVSPSISFTPTPGWNVDSGFRTEEHGAAHSVPRVTLTRGNVTFAIDADKFSGTPSELMTQIDAVSAATTGKSVLAQSSSPQPVTTAGGLTGVQVRFDTPSSAGSVTTFVAGGTGVRVQVVGPPNQVADRAQEIDAMIASIRAAGGNEQ